MSKIMTPCFNCDERTTICHASCDRYLAWKQKYASKGEATTTADIIGMKDCFQAKFKKFNGPYKRRG